MSLSINVQLTPLAGRPATTELTNSFIDELDSFSSSTDNQVMETMRERECLLYKIVYQDHVLLHKRSMKDAEKMEQYVVEGH